MPVSPVIGFMKRRRSLAEATSSARKQGGRHTACTARRTAQQVAASCSNADRASFSMSK